MTYQLTTNSEGLPLLIVNELIYFAWEDSNTEFTTALEKKGIEAFVELLASDPNTAYLIFIQP